LLPLLEARLVSPDGAEIEDYDTPGELLLRGPTIVLGYLNNEEANRETFQDGWMRTGDEAVVRKSPKGEDHIFIVDRLKELIKVKV
jgi:long-subunit acyl-CoA synthetase (AMP-forming)